MSAAPPVILPTRDDSHSGSMALTGTGQLQHPGGAGGPNPSGGQQNPTTYRAITVDPLDALIQASVLGSGSPLMVAAELMGISPGEFVRALSQAGAGEITRGIFLLSMLSTWEMAERTKRALMATLEPDVDGNYEISARDLSTLYPRVLASLSTFASPKALAAGARAAGAVGGDSPAELIREIRDAIASAETSEERDILVRELDGLEELL